MIVYDSLDDLRSRDRNHDRTRGKTKMKRHYIDYHSNGDLILKLKDYIQFLPISSELKPQITKLCVDDFYDGELPEDIGDLVNVRHVEIHNMAINLSLILQFEKLEVLNIYFNRYVSVAEELPRDIGNLKNLRELRLVCHIDIGSLPSSLFRLKKLEKLTLLNFRNLPGLSEEIQNLTS